MNISTDSLYSIGSTHRVCEDFALDGVLNQSGENPTPFAMVCDGCSSSGIMSNGLRNPLNVDFGARIIAVSAKKTIQEFLHFVKDYDDIGKNTVLSMIFKNILMENIFLVKERISVPFDIFDSTLLVAQQHKNKIVVYAYGDGVICFESVDYFDIFQIEYETNAPYYLSYDMSGIEETYKKQFGHGKKTLKKTRIFKTEFDVGYTEEFECPLYEPIIICSNEIENKNKVTLFSDGISSFVKDGKDLKLEEVFRKIISVESYKGEFLHKSKNILNRWMNKESINHRDDFSCAGISFWE